MTDTDHAEAIGVLNRVTTERDHARAIAVALENDIALLTEFVRQLRATEPTSGCHAVTTEVLDAILARVTP